MEVSRMACIKDGWKRVPWRNVFRLTPLAVFALWSLGFARVLWAEPPAQKTFASPAQACDALFRAAQKGDVAALVKIFGPEGKEIVSSGDAVEDKNNRDQFVEVSGDEPPGGRAGWKYQTIRRRRELADASP